MSENVEGIRVDVKELLLVDSDSYVEIAEISDDLIKGEVLKTLTKDDNDVEQHIISYSSMVKITAKSSNKDWYNITWEPFNQTNRHEIAGYDCGEELTATWEWQIIEAPRDEGASGYKSNVHCKWIVHSDQFDTIEYEPLQIDLMDEESGDCEDFIYFSDEWKGDKPKGKICEMPKTWSGSSRTSHFNLHFVSGQDASNNNGGFKIRYRLSCGNVVRIPRSNVNQYELTSPNYPSNMNRSESCLWVVFLTSRRLLNAQIVDIDIKEEQPCSVNNSLSLMSYDNFKPSHYCGHSAENPINFVSNLSTMKIEYNAELSDRRGFKLLLSENITECLDGTIHLTENKPSRMIYSPNYPAKIPISTECEYVISAPHGHRIMVTFDHNEFDLVNKLNNFTDLDFIELRDGPIEHSPLLGKYQGHEAPPTKFSSSNVMFMKLSTHWNLQLGGFVAKFEIAKCGGTKVIYDSEEVFYIIAPFTDTDIDCQWIVKSQNTHLLKMRFERLKIKHGSNCPEQQLVVYDGNVNSSTLYNNDCYPIPESEWKRSSSSEITITYKFSHEGLNRYKKSSEFRIAFQMSDITCGGIVKNTVGTLTPPMSLSKLLPRVKCVWNLQASPGFTFLLDILFHADDGNNYYFYDEKKNETCFPDFKIREKIDDKNYLEQTFCKSGRVLELYTLNGELIYDDRSSRESRATQSVSSFSRFVISYEEAPISPSSCSQSIDTSQTISFNSTFPRAELCLLSILQLTTHGTVSIKISDFGTEKIRCEHSLITVKSNDFPTFEDKYCASSIRNRTLDFVFTNHHIGLSVFQDHRVKQNNNFTIDIDFLECGGVIDRSTNFGNISMPISQKRCRWDFEAPVGQIIKIKVISMKIRTTINCFDNALYIREGRHDEQGLLHTYCHTTDNPGHETERLRDEYRVIKSKTRCLNIEWVRNTVFDTTMNWVLEYSYIDEGNDCGFHSSALSGVITTPNYNEKDYDNNLECIWDIHVPPGYHIKLNYEFFDVETSDNCVKDALIITETSQSMELALITSYQVQPFEEVKYPRVCGHHTPKDTFASTTRRLQLNFTTDGTVTSRGFKIRWEAECGAILTKEHGTVTSPNYPEAYTIAKDSCGYIIQADAEDIVSIRFEDVDLPIAKMRNNKCYADHIQIVQIPSNKILLTICGNNDVPEEVLSFRGTIGISLNKYGNYKTPYRGFKLTYQREECGKSIHLDDENNQVYINSPAFPLAHKHSLDCQWNVTTTRDRQLGFRFERFELDERSNCESDYVLISAKYYRSKHCGGRDDVSYETTNVKSSVMNVHLVTDAENNGKGFVMSIVSLLRPEQGCGGVVIADNTWRSIQPPRDKDGKYLPNLHCIWRIKTRKSSIQLKITDIDIERGPRQGCSYDYIKVYNGYHDIGVPLTDRICGNQSLPIMINKGGTSIELVFETDSSGSGSGFNMSYIMKNETACEIGLEPEYEPKKYRFEVKTRENTTQNQHVEEQRCSVMFWHTGEQKMITFNEIDFKSCDDGFVEIQYYGASDDSTLQHIKLCNNQTFTYTTPRLVIITMTAKNFDKPHAVEFTYQKVNVCNRTINTSLYGSGRVLFNTYIDSYANLTQCTTTIRSANNHGHSKSFLLAFKYYPSDGVQLQAKNIDNNHTLQNSYYGEELNITMNSTYSANRKAYDGTYFTVAEELDDGTIIFAENKDSSGTVTNIGYPNGYPASKTQIFTIRPPYQTPCTVHLETVSMNIRSDCNGPPTDEYLTVDIQQPSGLKNFDECEFGRFSEHKVNINGNEERVWKFTFKSDNNTKNDGRGFKFTWFCDVKLKHSRRHEVWL